MPIVMNFNKLGRKYKFWRNIYVVLISQSAFTCSNSTIEISEQHVKFVQNKK